MSNEFYEVERVVGKKRLENGKIVYLVKWVGYDSTQNTWESLQNLTNVKGMVDEYEKGLTNKDEDIDWKIGNFKDDTPKYIISSELRDNSIQLLVKWKKRISNVQPSNSYVSYSEMKNKYPLILLDFLEQNMLINNTQYEYQASTKEFHPRSKQK